MLNKKIGWIGLGRMGTPMVQKLLKKGVDVSIWNRTKSKAELLLDEGAKVVDVPSELSKSDILFSMVSTGKDLKEVLFGENGALSGPKSPKIIVDCSSIGADDSSEISEKVSSLGGKFLACPVSGNGKCVKAGKLSAVVSGDVNAFNEVKEIINIFAKRGSSYVGEGELARFCKIAHNLLLGVYTQNLAEITVLAQKAGVPRHAFLEFINNSVMGSIFSQYKTPAFVNLDWTTTFTPVLLRKDLDLGLSAARDLGVSMPITAATREALQAHFGSSEVMDRKDFAEIDFSALLETVANQAGLKLVSEEKDVKTGLETKED